MFIDLESTPLDAWCSDVSLYCDARCKWEAVGGILRMLCSLHHQAMIPKTKDSFSLLENLPRSERATETVMDVHQATIPKTEDSRDSILSFRESVRGSM